jgi:hypothetical protein
MSISPSISTIPHDLPEGFAFGAGEIVSGPGAPGRKAGPGLQRPSQGARMQPPKPASARPHPPHAVGMGVATCEGALDGVLEPHWPQEGLGGAGMLRNGRAETRWIVKAVEV